MIGFDDNYCLCNIFTIKFLFLTHTQAQLHVDGVPIGDHAAPEVIDDWALHSVAGLQSTKLVVGACWMGEYRLGVCWMGKYRRLLLRDRDWCILQRGRRSGLRQAALWR